MKLLCVSFAALMLALGCAGPEVHYDYDAKAKFPALHTYDWYAASPADQAQAGGVKNPFVDSRVRRAVENALAAKNFQKETSAEPDFLVTYYPVYVLHRYSRGLVGIGFGGPGMAVGVAGPIGGGPGWRSGSIVLEIQDAKTHQVIWKAEAEDAIDLSEGPEDSERDVSAAVNKMLLQFPPTRPAS
jgi:hypothetical protein